MLTSTQKAGHYQAQLNACLVAGKWTAERPAKDFKGSPISWPDLVRKARKHCDTEGKELADVAEQTRALVMLLVKSLGKAGNNLDGDKMSAESPLAAGEQHTLLEEDHAQAKKIIGKLGSEKPSQRRALSRAYFHYTMQDSKKCLEEITQIDLETFEDEKILGSKALEGSPPTHQMGSPRPGSIRTVHPQIQNGSIWATTELIRGFCIQGLCLEKESPSNHEAALTAYSKAISRITSLQTPKPTSAVPAPGSHLWSTSTPTPTSPSGIPPPPSNDHFVQYRELHRWTQHTLFRAVVLSSRREGNARETLQFARQHRQQSGRGCWPVSFRSRQRAVVLNLHLRALIRESESQSQSESEPGWSCGMGLGLVERMNEAKAVAGDYKTLLSYSTKFPRAGERNELVEEFVDLLFAFWGVNGFRGEWADWIIDHLWWATTLTFNSPRIYRHLTYLFASQATAHSHLLAKRTLKVYVEVVGKSRASGDKTNPELDEVWIRTLVDGARMLCRGPGAGDDKCGESSGDVDAEEDLKNALVYLGAARTDLGSLGEGEKEREKRELEAAVNLAEGIVLSVLAIKEENHSTRQDRLSSSIKLLERSLSTNPTPSANYHMALALYRPTPSQDIPRAIENAKKAIEGKPGDPRTWHLLGLLLMVSGEWAKSTKIVEEGIKVSERIFTRGSDGSGGSGAQKEGTAAHMQPNTIFKRRMAATTHETGAILEDSLSDSMPLARLLIPSIPDPPPASRREEFEMGLQLRLTLLALVEHAQGPEKAGASWLELFSWFRDRREWVVDGNLGAATIPQSPDAQEASSPASPPRKEETDQRSMHNKLHKLHSPKHSTNTRDELIPPTAIRITPPTPMDSGNGNPLEGQDVETRSLSVSSLPSSELSGEEQRRENGDDRPSPRRQGSKDSGHKSKKVQALLKTQVYKGAEGFKTVSRRISKAGVGKRQDGITLHRSSSAPDFHAVLAATRPYQASSIHSRSRLSSWNIHRSTAQEQVRARAASSAGTAPRTASILQSTPPGEGSSNLGDLNPWEKKLLSELWIRAAATFRRGDDLEECRSAIQEAEELDENNVGVWVQYGLYLVANSDIAQAQEVFNKALFVDPEDVSASIHLSNLLLSPPESKSSPENTTGTPTPSADDIQMAVGLLTNTTLYRGRDSAEAWYLLAKGRRLQGSKARERDCLTHALELSRVRGVRVIREAIGDCL